MQNEIIEMIDSDETVETDYAVPPGHSLRDLIEEKKISQTELAERMGRPRKTINEIIRGKVQITPETAIELEYVLGTPARLWLALEMNYRADLARIATAKHNAKHVSWIKKFPINEMVKRGWITATSELGRLEELLKFLGVAYPAVWDELWQTEHLSFRMANGFNAQNDDFSLAVWLRVGEIEASEKQCEYFSEARLKQRLSQLRQATALPVSESIEVMQQVSAEAGIAVVFVPELKNTHICGATYWVSPDKSVIQLSMRYKTLDSLWFTFFHEVGHILLHNKADIYLDDDTKDGEQESEADKFARDTLIPLSAWRTFIQRHAFKQIDIEQFASSQGIGPDIVLGRLQHEKKMQPVMLASLKRSLQEWIHQREAEAG